MKRYLKIILVCFLSISCAGNKALMKSNILVLEKVYMDQLAHYNNIEDKANYMSIINFGKQERNMLAEKATDVITSGRFTILEGFNPAWGDFVGLIWNDSLAYGYNRSAGNKKIRFVKLSLSNIDLQKANNNIPSHIIEKVKEWDIDDIRNIENQIGMGVSDGFCFIATRVDMNNLDKSSQIETVSFEQFAIE